MGAKGEHIVILLPFTSNQLDTQNRNINEHLVILP